MSKFLFNRIANAGNSYQGAYKRVLCVCSAGLLRSPTAAVVLSQEPFNFNTRCAGLTEEFALIPVDAVLLKWADEVVCMEERQAEKLRTMTDAPVISLNIEDSFEYRNPDLIKMITDRYQSELAMNETVEELSDIVNEIEDD